MIPLAERLKKKAEREKKLAMRLSGKVKTFSVRIPWQGYPYRNTEGDKLYHKKKVEDLVTAIIRKAGHEFYQDVKAFIAQREKDIEERRKARDAMWAKQAEEATQRLLATQAATAPAVPTEVAPATPPPTIIPEWGPPPTGRWIRAIADDTLPQAATARINQAINDLMARP